MRAFESSATAWKKGKVHTCNTVPSSGGRTAVFRFVSLAMCVRVLIIARYRIPCVFQLCDVWFTVNPRNFAFSPRGTEMVVHTVQAWVQQYPADHVVSDDKIAMFPTASRAALFNTLKIRRDHNFAGYVPTFRLLYFRTARVFMSRREGEFMMPVATPADVALEDVFPRGADAASVAGDAYIPLRDHENAVLQAVRRCRGWDHGRGSDSTIGVDNIDCSFARSPPASVPSRCGRGRSGATALK